MNIITKNNPLLAVWLVLLVCSSCAREFMPNNYAAYFGGEVANPTNPYVLFFRDDVLIDSIRIDKKNRFFAKFDSLSPGLYTFRHDPEYQYVYFDKNDSLMVAIDSRSFDESIVFSGRGDQKNNFLMELYLKNESDREKMFRLYDLDVQSFNRAIDSMYRANSRFYQEQKQKIQWAEDFDLYARAMVDFPHYSKKEIYPVMHQIRTGNDVVEKLPEDYYDFRKTINFNDSRLSNYSPFVKYLSFMLNNMAAIKYHNHYSDVDLALKTNTNKLDIADTLIRNPKIKNTILNNIAFTYLLEDQNMTNNRKFLEAYNRYSTDKSKKNEITRIGNAIKQMSAGNPLPEVLLLDPEGETVSSDDLGEGKKVIFFWTDNAISHLEEAHKKALQFSAAYPDYEFIAVNVDHDQEKWLKILSRYDFKNIKQYRCSDFDDMQAKWAITKIHRTIILDADKTIRNAFTNLFDSEFAGNLE